MLLSALFLIDFANILIVGWWRFLVEDYYVTNNVY